MKQCMIYFCARAGHILHQRTQNLETSNIACKKEKEISSLPSFDMTKLLLSHDNYHNGSMKIPIFLFNVFFRINWILNSYILTVQNMIWINLMIKRNWSLHIYSIDKYLKLIPSNEDEIIPIKW